VARGSKGGLEPGQRAAIGQAILDHSGAEVDDEAGRDRAILSDHDQELIGSGGERSRRAADHRLTVDLDQPLVTPHPSAGASGQERTGRLGLGGHAAIMCRRPERGNRRRVARWARDGADAG